MPVTQTTSSPKLLRYLPAIVFALLSFILYADCLFDPQRLPASPQTDLEMQFLSWREFGFGEMSMGNLPLWNPHIFGGTPYMASFQSALFYPLNWLHLILPVGLAISWYVAIHSFLMGYFTSLWARYRGAGSAGQILGGCMVMFSGQYYLHAFAGHLPHLAVMVWVPLIFLSVDALADGRSWRWVLLGGAALALQILAGHPQYVYYTGLTLGLYALLRMIFSAARLRIAIGLISIAIIGAALSAIQLLPGLAAAGENVRVGGLPYPMASQFSAAPEQFFTLLAPYIFGHMGTVTRSTETVVGFYIGEGYLWELCFFMSISGLLLAAAGFAKTSRVTRISFGVPLLLLIIVSVGSYTPVHRLLYDHLPGFASFRAPAKLMFFAGLFLAMLAAQGLEFLKQNDPASKRRIAVVSSGIAGLALLLAIIFRAGGATESSPWGKFLSLLKSRPVRFNPAIQDWPGAAAVGLDFAFYSLLLVAATLAIIAAIAFMLPRRPRLIALLPMLAILELSIFAAIGRGSMSLNINYPSQFAQAMQNNPEQYRSLHLASGLENAAMSLGTFDMWGYDPGLLRRYGQFLAASQGNNPDAASQYLRFTNTARFDRLYRMFRLRWVFAFTPEPRKMTLQQPMPRAQLIAQYEVLPNRDEMLARILDDSFDPAALVFLEQPPAIQPAAAPVQGTVKVNPIDSDKFAIDVTTDSPAILLITDNYADGWHATAIGPAAAQSAYQVLPANYCLRAIPLQAGAHHILMEYEPSAFIVGRWITAISAVGFIVALWLAFRRPRTGEAACPAT